MTQGNQIDFMNMIQDYESHEFQLCWINFKEMYPNSNFPKDYAEHIWNETMAEGLEDSA